MKYSKIFTSIIFLLLIVITDYSFAGDKKVAKIGIGFRGAYWNMNNGDFSIRVRENNGFSEINIGGLGGSLYFFSRVSEQMFVDFSLGAVASVEERSFDFRADHVKSNVITPILFGLRMNLLSIDSQSALEPYISGGVGAYILSDVNAHYIDSFDEEVTVNSITKAGAYAGGGLNFMFSKGFGMNYDVRYHWIDFQTEEYNSGFEFSIGFLFMWGTYKN